MATSNRRIFSLGLALALTGCGEAPGSVARLDAVPTGAAPSVKAAAQLPGVTVTQTAEAVAAEASAAKVTPAKDLHLFDHDYTPADIQKADLKGDDPSVSGEMGRQYQAAGISYAPGTNFGVIGTGIVAGLFGAGALGYAVYTGMIGSRDLLYPSDKEDLNKDPMQYGIPYSQDPFKSHDGLNLTAWYVPAEVPTNKGIMVYHGHTSNKDRAFAKYGLMLHHDYNLYFYNSRFHGDSEGKLTTLGYYERRDAVIALQRLRDKGNTSIGVMGESMGGAVAIDSTAMDPSVKACWADCAFDSLHDAIAPRAVKRKYPFPNFVATSVIAAAGIRAHGVLTDADPIKWVGKIAPRPLYLVHGQADDDTTPENSDKLFEKAGQPKAIWRTADAH
ncbi:MAG: Alpha/beta hydrolase family, partial [Cyanobacteria bacterium RYN_339]|nr:Alpha/beta hydrolase family [Cyanobacteria bacterium RYN_339]